MTRIAYHLGFVCLLRKGFSLLLYDETLFLSGDSPRLPKALGTLLVFFNIELAWIPVPPFYALQGPLLPCPHRDRVHQHRRSLTTYSSLHTLGLALRYSVVALALQRTLVFRSSLSGGDIRFDLSS